MSPPFAPTRAISSDRAKIVKTKTEDPASRDENEETVVLNFARYYNSWRDSRENSIVPLKYQFESTDVSFTRGRDERDFLRAHLYDKDARRTLHISHPPLEKKNRLSSNSLELESVLIRINSKESPEFDLVLQGNIETRQQSGSWEFMVFRMFFTQHGSRYIGEITRECRIYTRLNLANMDSHVLIDLDGNDFGRGRVNYTHSIFTGQLIEELCSKSIVLNPSETLSYLDSWNEFLTFMENQSLAKKDRFAVVRPRAYHAYYGSDTVDLNPSKILMKDDGIVWTEEAVPRFSQCVFIRLEHPIGDRMEPRDLRKYTERFDAVCRSAPVLIDPANESREYRLDPEELKRQRELARLGERISESEYIEDGNRGRLTVCFRIAPPKDKATGQFLRELSDFYASHSQLFLTESDVAAKVSINRQRTGINAMRNGTLANPLLTTYLDDPSLLPEPKSGEIGHYFGNRFNELQKKAVNGAVFSRGLYLIQGPPGTGKTQVIAEITAQEVIRGRKVLITSQGNKAVDNAFERLSKHGFIRPVRIMADRKENDYDIDHLVSGFCRSTADSINFRTGLYSDDDRRKLVGGKITEFKECYRREYIEAATRARTVIAAIDKFSRNHDERVDDINCRNAENRYVRNRISECVAASERLSDFEYRDFGRFHKIIRDMFPFVPEGCVLEDVLYGKGMLCSRLLAMDDEEVAEEQGKVDDYSPGNGSVIAETFGKPIPLSIGNLRANLLNFWTQVQDEISRELDELRGRNTADADTRAAASDSYLSKISEYSQKPEYVEYINARDRLHMLISELFSLLNVSRRYDTVEEAKRIIDDEERRLDLMEGEDLGLCLDAMREVVEYLSGGNAAEAQKEKLQEELSGYVNVIGATSTSKDSVLDYEGLDLKKIGVDTIIVDEVSKVPFCELMYPLSFGKKVILVGDQKQLPPVYNENAEEDELKDLNRKYSDMYTEPVFAGLFDRAPEYAKTMLTTQYRMSEKIMNVINRFYGGALLMGCRPEDKLHRLSVQGTTRGLIDGNVSVLFVNTDGKEERESGSTSFLNMEEAQTVSRLIRLLDRNCRYNSAGNPVNTEGEDNMSLGVITPYKDQIKTIRKLLHLDMDDSDPEKLRLNGFRSEGEEKFMVKSVDDFQGDERDVIILSLVRTSSSSFISDFRRINVAMSRARRLLIIVGNAEALCRETVDLDEEHKGVPVYEDIITELRNGNCYVDSSEVPEVKE